MTRDFTLTVYKSLIESMQGGGYTIVTFEDYLRHAPSRCIILRHDVDHRAGNALRTAALEKDLGIKGTYYFRIVSSSNQPAIIREIAGMGHEIGYHYEDLSLAGGDHSRAYQNFLVNLEYFRQFYPVSTICMHGRPLSFLDNKKLWEHYNYKDSNLIGEPYFDVDFDRVLYLTDTGRHWNSSRSNYFDKVISSYHINLSSTSDVIRCLHRNCLPDQVMITIHPERWNEAIFPWMAELTGQNIKNLAKVMLRRFIR